MKFEKLNENKIRITLNHEDLRKKNIDYDSFLSNSVETQDLFLDMLEEAEEKVGFITKNYKIKIEALAMDDGKFILTVTRIKSNESVDTLKLRPRQKKSKTKRKKSIENLETLVYEFNNFEDFLNFTQFVCKTKAYLSIAKTTTLYTYNNKYYLLFSNQTVGNPYIKKFYTLITEFATYVPNSDLFAYKLYERGKITIKNNALKNCSKYFK